MDLVSPISSREQFLFSHPKWCQLSFSSQTMEMYLLPMSRLGKQWVLCISVIVLQAQLSLVTMLIYSLESLAHPQSKRDFVVNQYSHVQQNGKELNVSVSDIAVNIRFKSHWCLHCLVELAFITGSHLSFFLFKRKGNIL